MFLELANCCMCRNDIYAEKYFKRAIAFGNIQANFEYGKYLYDRKIGDYKKYMIVAQNGGIIKAGNYL